MFFRWLKHKDVQKKGMHLTNVDSNCVFFETPAVASFRFQPVLGVQAVGHIHQQGMLHRDIKPDNLVMRRHLGEFRRQREIVVISHVLTVCVFLFVFVG